MFARAARMATLCLALLPATAAAEWLFTPALGTTFGADTHGREHTTFGASLGWFDEEAFGWEADIFYTPGFFEGEYDQGFFLAGESSVTGAMFNGVMGVPGDRVLRPYGTVGVGLMQMRVLSSGAGLFESTTRELGWNAGGGLMALFGDTIGLRADVRYIRSFQDEPPSWTRGIDFDVAPGNFDFLRAMVGVTFRFPE